MHRVFVAISISQELQQEIIGWEKNYSSLPIRWLNGKNLHITLIPPWEADDVELEKEKLTSIAGKIKPFEVIFEKVQYGPDPRQPRLIWACGKATREALELKEILEGLFGHKSEYRNWTMHLTLARFHPKTFSSFSIKGLNESVHWPEKVKSVVFMESHLLPEGSDYEILEEVEL